MAEEREEISCECQEIHEDLLKIVNETMPDEEELYDLADLFKVFGGFYPYPYPVCAV